MLLVIPAQTDEANLSRSVVLSIRSRDDTLIRPYAVNSIEYLGIDRVRTDTHPLNTAIDNLDNFGRTRIKSDP